MNKLFILILSICVLAARGQDNTGSLESFIGFSGVSNLTSNSDGSTLAWVINDRGMRNIQVRRGSTTTTLTKYFDDDGQEISQVRFSPDGNWIWYVRGGGANTEGVSPNPASLAGGVERAVWRVPVSGGSTERIVAAGAFRFSKNGTTFLFNKGGQIHEANMIPAATSSPLFTARGGNGDFSESPDGTEILFTSDRGDHSFTGIFNRQSGKIRWIGADVYRDVDPVWSPDGKQVAFLRMPGLKDDEIPDLTADHIFRIVVADAATGNAKVIWTSPGKFGGHAQSYPSPVFAWHASGRIQFFSEHTGWTHLWSIRPDGSDLRDITPGDGEVETYIAAPDGKTLYFDTNIGDINRRHIWKTNAESGKPVQVTFGDGSETHPIIAGEILLCQRSSINNYNLLVRPSADGKTFGELTTSPAVFRPAQFVGPEAVIFTAADGTKVHGQLFINRRMKGKRPGILFMHGGPTRQMLLSFHYSDYYSYSYAFNQYLASKGYIVLSVNYRNGIGYGRDFRNSPDQGPRGAVEYQDIQAAGKYLQALSEVAADQIGLWGGSYGGYLTAMGLARNPELFKAGVDVHGVHDWAFRGRTFWVPGGWWGLTEKDMDLAWKSSPVSDLSKWTAPVLLISGDDDRNVQFQETTDLAMKLMERNVPVETLVLPDEVHGFLRYESWRKVFSSAADFFTRRLPVSVK